MIEALAHKTHWIFDMDGTLTHSIHNFDEIRRELGLPEDKPILESILNQEPKLAEITRANLDLIELDVASRSTAADGVIELLDYLKAKDRQVGILTRNSLKNAHVTLKAAGLADYFSEQVILSRDCATPKPSPDGIIQLLSQWHADVENAVMLGDFHYDLDAGSNAKVTTIYIDPSERFPFKDRADICIKNMFELIK